MKSIATALGSLLLTALLLAGCGSPRLLPGSAPPSDFHLVLASRDARNPHCDFDLDLQADGQLEYDVRHRGVRPARRRGAVVLAPDRMQVVWDAVLTGEAFSLPERIEPRAGEEERGRVHLEVRGDGRRRTVDADRAGHPGLDHLLRAVYWAVPHELWQSPDRTDRPR